MSPAGNLPYDDSIVELGLLEDEGILLDDAALRLAALDHPHEDLAPYADVLEVLVERLAVVGEGAGSAEARAGVLAEVIAGDFEFVGDGETYDDPDNADLIRVIDRRRGLPVTLTILYVAAARRLGWPAEALNTPGHVLASIGGRAGSVVVDPFHSGRIMDADSLAALVREMLGPEALPLPEFFEAMSNRSVLVRLLMNQASRAEAKGQAKRALTLYERMTVVAPSHGPTWWERARLQLMDADVAGARSSLSAMLEVTREPGMRSHIRSALDALAGAR